MLRINIFFLSIMIILFSSGLSRSETTMPVCVSDNYHLATDEVHNAREAANVNERISGINRFNEITSCT